jgi:hypothetical protein
MTCSVDGFLPPPPRPEDTTTGARLAPPADSAARSEHVEAPGRPAYPPPAGQPTVQGAGCIGLFFADAANIWRPCDFRHVGLHHTAGYILGVDPEETPPRRAFADDGQPLAERERWLRYAALFAELSSGLVWLARAAGPKMVMVGGFTHPTNEFTTPYRVINYYACNSCWNDPRVRFGHGDFLWCPRHAGTPRHFECTRLITPAQVLRTIARAPDFGCGDDAPSDFTNISGW